jgi:REP element-mobilizing transposase RayT
MAGTYTQIYIHAVFAVKNKLCLIQKENKNEIFKYVAGILKGKKQKPIIVNGTQNHIHLLFGLNQSSSVSEIIRDVKNNSTNYINKNKYSIGRFSWQEGYGAFSYSRSQIETIYNYIYNQESHHKKKSFEEEYKGFLKKFEVSYKEEYLFEWNE